MNLNELSLDREPLGLDCVTRPVVPLQLTLERPHLADKIGLTKQGSSLFLQDTFLMDTVTCDSYSFLSRMNNCFVNLLKQHNPENPYDKIVLVFQTWQQADTFLHWVRLAEFQVKIVPRSG